MKKKYLAFTLFTIVSLLLIWGYLKLNDRVTLNLSNNSNVDLNWQWTCNSVAQDDSHSITSGAVTEVTVYPACEGEFGVLVIEAKQSHHQKLIGYIPTGKPTKIAVSIVAPDQVTFKIEGE